MFLDPAKNTTRARRLWSPRESSSSAFTCHEWRLSPVPKTVRNLCFVINLFRKRHRIEHRVWKNCRFRDTSPFSGKRVRNWLRCVRRDVCYLDDFSASGGSAEALSSSVRMSSRMDNSFGEIRRGNIEPVIRTGWAHSYAPQKRESDEWEGIWGWVYH